MRDEIRLVPTNRLDDIAAEIRTTWVRVERDIEATRALLSEARDLCHTRGESFDTWLETRKLGFGKRQGYNILAGHSSSPKLSAAER